MSIYDSSPRPKTAHLDVYDTKAPERPYKVIALLTCEGAPKEEAAMTTAILYRARMMGAGFGGCAISLVEEGAVPELRERVSRDYQASFGRTSNIHVIRIEAGTHVI